MNIKISKRDQSVFKEVLDYCVISNLAHTFPLECNKRKSFAQLCSEQFVQRARIDRRVAFGVQ